MRPRRDTTTERDLSTLVSQMCAISDRAFFVAQVISGYAKGRPYYRYCLAETVNGKDYTRTTWHRSKADLLADLRKRGQEVAA